MQTQTCPFCNKRIPWGGYCIYCGKVLPKYKRCSKCNAILLSNVIRCPSCDSNILPFNRNDDPQINSSVTATSKFRPAILVIFLFATYSVIQLTISFLVYLFFPNEMDIENNALSFLSLLVILIISNVLMIGFITRIISFSFEERTKKESMNKLWLIIIFILAISSIDIFTSIVDILLDFIGISKLQTSPYDQFFGDPVGIIGFTFLVAFVGPLFEELVYRRCTISAMSKLTDSKMLLICFSALIFAFSHLPSDVLNGSLRYTLLHLCATIVLGIILGIVYILWGLRGAIIFHSSWNIFSLLVQILVDNRLTVLVDLLILLITCITFVSVVLSFFHFRANFNDLLFNIPQFSTNEFMSIFSNFVLIIMYTLFPVLFQVLFGQNLVTIGINLILYILGIFSGIILLSKDNQTAILI
ncbi:MAG: type II CAAX prenyl endopeptidase Rce1 family protein [Candidatus Hodarchaeota archaeon]